MLPVDAAEHVARAARFAADEPGIPCSLSAPENDTCTPSPDKSSASHSSPEVDRSEQCELHPAKAYIIDRQVTPKVPPPDCCSHIDVSAKHLPAADLILLLSCRRDCPVLAAQAKTRTTVAKTGPLAPLCGLAAMTCLKSWMQVSHLGSHELHSVTTFIHLHIS